MRKACREVDAKAARGTKGSEAPVVVEMVAESSRPSGVVWAQMSWMDVGVVISRRSERNLGFLLGNTSMQVQVSPIRTSIFITSVISSR